MNTSNYRDQIELLLDVLPLVAQEEFLALHGGTAINLFVRNMPRLSVDIDLTYLPLGDRQESLSQIHLALERLKNRIEKILGVAVQYQTDTQKLVATSSKAQVKVEVNPVGRGLIAPAQKMILCDKAQEEFDRFVEINVVSTGQLYGGKICAALNRQHPRDLFDVQYLLENEGFTDEIKQGFIYNLLSSSAPINEVLLPNLLDQRKILESQFEGMSVEPFTYSDFEKARQSLLEAIQGGLTLEDRKFLLSVKDLSPDWSVYDFKDFPSVKWKLQNIERLRSDNPSKYHEQRDQLKNKLGF
ncbi:nucleotidyl transferase AbiEii/AbiGii toxin family protein [Polynucleobacter sp. IMCC 30228]|uniref:nucleotidyl transferase AbiEii/AbiGii toxin family protein n=1 Tax=Polynucleobacter sp. IMCC 30228 TaxID=2781011 RepID=UPI001F3DFC50|nr:nucleotidyl transferase AbiEii/AbiGii toxin family protein [Polynucleobacter sp. IMCC 30228]MCE7527477.1 nucleotidyl transferase AbiEii/AbiGii toxin family protein [Polynucleobacter sp. IMCC 30228]